MLPPMRRGLALLAGVLLAEVVVWHERRVASDGRWVGGSHHIRGG